MGIAALLSIRVVLGCRETWRAGLGSTVVFVLVAAVTLLVSSAPADAHPAGASPDLWIAAEGSVVRSAATVTPTDHVYLPFAVKMPSGCAAIPGQTYDTFDVPPPPSDRPAAEHADLNLALRGYEVTDAYLGLVSYSGNHDPGAPQLYGLFADGRIPDLTTVYQVYDWDWPCNCRGELLDDWDVTLAGLATTAGETIHVPASGYSIGGGYEALVLYATPSRITLKYTPDDNVIDGYTLHIENVCVEPSLLALYEQWNEAGRDRLPALHAGQPLGRAIGGEVGVAIRDVGRFMDPRSEEDWWDQ